MNTALYNYDIWPMVFEKGRETEITVRPLGGHAAFALDLEYYILICPLQEGTPRHYPGRNNFSEYYAKPCADGNLRFSHRFETEQEYYIRISKEDDSSVLCQLSVYALSPDLAGRCPLRGDFHAHSSRSDGKESPAVVCANYRKQGYDFLPITDHERYYPSLEAMEAYRDIPIDLCIVPGEEVHLPNDETHSNDVHIVNFGGEYSVNALVEGDHTREVGTDKNRRSLAGLCPDAVMSPAEFHKTIDKFAKALSIPEGIEPYAYAACLWIFNEIRKANGLGIFCHPYWISNVYHVPETFTDYLMETRPFDAFEVLGGELYFEQNGFQTIRYYEDMAKGRRYPIVGASDSHGSTPVNPAWNVGTTLVFARENERTSIISAVKEFYSVGIDNMSRDYRLVGELRLVRYARFLLENYFPLHDELCFEEGRLMKDYVCGDACEKEAAAEGLKAVYGRTDRRREKYFQF